MMPSNTLKTNFFSQFQTGSWLALYTTSPNAADVGGVEVTGGSYARQAITFGAPNLTTGVMTNTNAISFANLPAAAIKYYGIRTAATGGTLKSYGTISSISTVSGDEIQVAVGGITISFAGA